MLDYVLAYTVQHGDYRKCREYIVTLPFGRDTRPNDLALRSHLRQVIEMTGYLFGTTDSRVNEMARELVTAGNSSQGWAEFTLSPADF